MISGSNCMDLWWNVLIFNYSWYIRGQISSPDMFEGRFWAHQNIPTSSLAHAQCATMWMNTVSILPVVILGTSHTRHDKALWVRQEIYPTNNLYLKLKAFEFLMDGTHQIENVISLIGASGWKWYGEAAFLTHVSTGSRNTQSWGLVLRLGLPKLIL